MMTPPSAANITGTLPSGVILAQVTNLTITFPGQSRPAVDSVSLSVASGECLALVGESGSGKSLTARALLGLLPSSAQITGEIQVTDADGRFITAPPPRTRAWTAIRGAHSGLVPQDALGALDPLRRIELEVGDALRLHGIASGADRRKRVITALHDAGMPEPELRLTQRSDELSGGLRQRALVAAALIATPQFIVADEPTTALDAGHRSRVLSELRARVDGISGDGSTGSRAGVLLITHDLASVRGIADRVLVMREGQIIESGSPEEVLNSPQHPFTQELLAASPEGKTRTVRSIDRSGTPRLAASGVSMSFGHGASRRRVLSDVGLDVYAGETVGLVGESGSGKTTLLRIILGLQSPDSGTVEIDGISRAHANARVRRELRRKIAFVSQDPLDSFPVGATGRAILLDALRASGVPRKERATRAHALADDVRINSVELIRPAATLSGGQRQRLSLARALARDPQLLILDEPVSALDLTVQARVLALLNELQERRNTAFILVSHDAEVIRAMSDRVLQIAEGRISRQ